MHGVESGDGGFVLGGKLMDTGGGTNGFVVKLSMQCQITGLVRGGCKGMSGPTPSDSQTVLKR